MRAEHFVKAIEAYKKYVSTGQRMYTDVHIFVSDTVVVKAFATVSFIAIDTETGKDISDEISDLNFALAAAYCSEEMDFLEFEGIL